MNTIDKIRAEIERRKKYQLEQFNKKKPDGRPNDGWAESLAIMGELEDFLSFLDTLEEPVSEEDEDMLNSCISSIEEAKENRYAYKETDGDTSYDHEIAWLKSLRPSWKPSEEQMKMLAMFTNLRCASRREANTLESLYNDLKKLM